MARAAPLQKKPDKSSGGRGGAKSAKPVQRQMTVGPSRDRFEAEADRAASHVISGAAGAPTITPLGAMPAQRKAEDDEKLQRAAKAPDEDKLQRKAKAPDDEKLQRKAKAPDEDKLQRKPKRPEEEPVQRDATGTGPGTAPAGVESGIRAARGSGRPLSDTTRTQMESGFGRDFGAVRIHDDARADRLNSGLNARAFTTGSDVFFSRGAYNPDTRPGQTLLAHELSHVAQQTATGGLRTSTLQRASNAPDPQPKDEDNPPKASLWKPSPKSKEAINLDGPQGLLYSLPKLELPKLSTKIKGVDQRGSIAGGMVDGRSFIPDANFLWAKKGKREVTEKADLKDNTPSSSQVQIWENYIKSNSSIAEKITKKFEKSKNVFTRGPDGPRVYYLQHKALDARIFTLVGTAEEIAENSAVLRPPFAPQGQEVHFMQVDHYVEIQLGGLHSIKNMWLLDEKANQKSGNSIKTNVVNDLNALVDKADKDDFWGDTNPAKPARFKSWPAQGHIEFARIIPAGMESESWDKDEIAAGKQIDRLKEMTAKQMKDAGLGLKPGDQPSALTIFLSKDSAFRRIMKVKESELSYRGSGKKDSFIKGFDLQSAVFHQPEAAAMQDDAQIATLTGRAFGNRTVKTPGGEEKKLIEAPNLAIPVRLRTQHGYESYIDRSYINDAIKKEVASITGASPIGFAEVGLTDAWELLARGTVRADNPLFSGVEFAITVQGDAVTLSADIPLDKLKFGPFEPTEAALSIGVDKKGVFFAGDAAFRLKGVGSGTLSASKQKLAGSFAFDIDAFDPAEIDVAYENGAWSAAAKLGIKPKTIPYVETANVAVAVDETGFSMNGTATLAGPGIPSGTELEISYSQETGALKFGADVPFDTAAIPGLSSARASLALSRSAEGAWSIAGSGAASVSLPYVTGSGKASYEDGYIDAKANAKISRPPMTGEAKFNLSNRPLDDTGQAVEGPPLQTFRIWGAGLASVSFGKYITGTIGITFLEDGQIELVGTVALPKVIRLIEPVKYNYNILDIPRVDIPIIGLTVPVIRKNFGVFAYVDGGIDAVITLGPGDLVDTEVTVTYNPDEPENASIVGGTTFEMGAAAEIGLSVRGGIGAGLGIVEATGDVGIRGALGLGLTGGGSVLLNWTPTQGLEVDAEVFGEASPKFKLSLIAGARITVDVWAWSGTIWSHEWDHTLAEIGPDIKWEARLPGTWSERDGLDVDIRNLEITKPAISMKTFGKEIFDAVT